MNKVCGLLKDFTYRKEDRTTIYFGYGLESVEDSELYTWQQVVVYKKQHPNLTNDEAKRLIINDINENTSERILTGFVWNDINVWLSEDNQRNFSDAQRIAEETNGQNLPAKFKLGEDANGDPVYYTFATVADITDFYHQMVEYIHDCLLEGWELKDSIDWSLYEIEPKAVIPEIEQQ